MPSERNSVELFAIGSKFFFFKGDRLLHSHKRFFTPGPISNSRTHQKSLKPLFPNKVGHNQQ